MSNLFPQVEYTFVDELKQFLKSTTSISPSLIRSTMNISPSTSAGPPPPPPPPPTLPSIYPVSAPVRIPSPTKKLKYYTFTVPVATPYVPSTNTDWRNINDNIDQIKTSFVKGLYSDHIIGFKLNLGPVKGDRSDPLLFPYLYLASVGESILLAKPQRDNISMIISIMNLTAPNVKDKALDEEKSQTRFVAEVKALIATEGVTNKYFTITEKGWSELVAEDNKLPPFDKLTTDILTSDIKPDTADKVMKYLLSVSTDFVKKIGRVIYIQTFVAFAKRGAITEEKCSKLNEQILQDLMFDPKIKPELTNTIYDNMKHLISETNAGSIFTTWADNMSEFSLRARILLTQTVGSGLTSLYVIKEAFTIAPNFNWAQAAQILPQDFQNVKQAFALVGNNPYYGFAADLGAVKSTNYKSLAYLAKELCKKIGGPAFASLSSYGGWTTNPLHKAILNQMVKTYNPVEVDDEGILVGVTQNNIDESSDVVREVLDTIKIYFL